MSFGSKSAPITNQAERDDLELGVRRALGLGASGQGQKRRFVRDGEVPVVVVRGRRDLGHHTPSLQAGSAAQRADSEAEGAAVRTEHEARERAERALAAAQVTIRDLQTKLGHMALAQDDARVALRRADQERQTLETALRDERNVRESAEAQLRHEVTCREGAEKQLLALTSNAAVTKTTEKPRQTKTRQSGLLVEKSDIRKRPGRPKSVAKSQKPVNWWAKPKTK